MGRSIFRGIVNYEYAIKNGAVSGRTRSFLHTPDDMPDLRVFVARRDQGYDAMALVHFDE